MELARPASSANRRGYTGQELDRETGLVAMGNGARDYAPELGRFLEQDSWTGSAAEAQTMNRYAYAVGNPLAYVDPSGHTPQLVSSQRQMDEAMVESGRVRLTDGVKEQALREVLSARLPVSPTGAFVANFAVAFDKAAGDAVIEGIEDAYDVVSDPVGAAEDLKNSIKEKVQYALDHPESLIWNPIGEFAKGTEALAYLYFTSDAGQLGRFFGEALGSNPLEVLAAPFCGGASLARIALGGVMRMGGKAAAKILREGVTRAASMATKLGGRGVQRTKQVLASAKQRFGAAARYSDNVADAFDGPKGNTATTGSDDLRVLAAKRPRQLGGTSENFTKDQFRQELVRRLKGITDTSDAIANDISSGKIIVNVVDDAIFEKLGRALDPRHGVGDALAFAYGRKVYFRKSVAGHVFERGQTAERVAGTAVHEGLHARDYLYEPENYSKWSNWRLELRAYLAEREYLIYRGAQDPWPTWQSLRRHIRSNHPRE